MRDFNEMIQQLRASGALDPLQADAAQALTVFWKALKPFADIALERDHDERAPDMISGPDLAITPAQVRAARKVLGGVFHS